MLDIPSLIIINEKCLKDTNVIDLCKLIRSSEDNSSTPIMVLTSDDSKEHQIDILKLGVEYCISSEVSVEYLYYTIKNITNLLVINRGISPLTKLPRKYSYTSRIKKTFT